MVYTVVVRNAPFVKYTFETLTDVKKNAMMTILRSRGKKWDKYLLVYEGGYSPKKQPVMSIERNEMDATWAHNPFNLFIHTFNSKGECLGTTELNFNIDKADRGQLRTMFRYENALECDFMC